MDTWILIIVAIALVVLFFCIRDYYAGDLKIPSGTTAAKTNSGKTLLAIVNPVGGRRRATRVWHTMVPYLESAGIKCTVVKTERSLHAQELAKEAVSSRSHDIVLCVGGDGILHEIVNGMMDAGHFIPIGVCAEGTGNGTATSLGVRTTYDAVEALVAGGSQPLDLLDVTQNNKNSEIAHLSVAWGAIADHDYYAEEKYRWIGMFRTILAPVLCIANAVHYDGQISLELAEQDQKWTKFGGRQSHWANSFGKTKAKTVEENGTKWHVIKDRFVVVHACNGAWISHDAEFVPGALHDDGVMHVVVLRGQVTRMQMIKMFLTADTGKHIHHDVVEVYACKQIKIEPDNTKVTGHISVDGELHDCVNTEARVRPAAGKLFTLDRKNKSI